MGIILKFFIVSSTVVIFYIMGYVLTNFLIKNKETKGL